jgi:hypothetical protein
MLCSVLLGSCSASGLVIFPFTFRCLLIGDGHKNGACSTLRYTTHSLQTQQQQKRENEKRDASDFKMIGPKISYSEFEIFDFHFFFSFSFFASPPIREKLLEKVLDACYPYSLLLCLSGV